MRKSLIFFAIVIFVSADFKVQYEQGVENSIHWAPEPYHILHQGSGVPRSVEISITFASKFAKVPSVILGSIMIDLANGQPSGFDSEIIQVTETGFRIRLTAVSPNQLYGVFFNWFAIYDPSVLIKEYTTSSVGSLASGSNELRTLSIPIVFDKQFESPPNVAIFLTGVQFIQRNNIISLAVKDVTATGFTIEATTWWLTAVSFFRCHYIAAPATAITAGQLKYRVDSGQSPMAAGSPLGERAESFSSDITDPKFQTGERFVFFGFSGYDVDDRINQRLFIKNVELGKKTLTGIWGTWWDSVTYQIEAYYFVYVPDKTQKLFDPDCAEVFAQCNYQGESITICDRLLSFPSNGWNKPVRSYQIPKGKVLKVYNQENLKGSVLKLEQSNECATSTKFTFAQLYSNNIDG